MELFQLKSFVALVEAGSVTAAAERLCLTQPAVTQQLRALEKELGVQLFDRTPRGVVLTQAGSVFKEYVERGLSTLDAGRRAAIELEGGEAGTLLLGAGVTTSVSHLPEWLQIFQREYPNVDVVVRTGRSAQVSRMVAAREIDLGIVTSRTEIDGLTYAPLLYDEIILVRSAKEGPSAPLSADGLAHLPMIVFPPRTGFRDFLDHALAQQNLGLRIKMETDSVEAIKSFVMVGLGASFLPERSVADEIAHGTLVRVEVEGMSPLRRETAAVYRTGSHLNAAARGFLDLLTHPEAHGGHASR